MPFSGPGWEVLRPQRNRFWGNPALLAFLKDVTSHTRGLGSLLIADMAQPRGGHMSYGHGSHQTGLDVDILYRLANAPLSEQERSEPAMDGVLLSDATPNPELWGKSQVALVKTFARDPRVERIFVNAAIKRTLCREAGEDRSWLSVLRPWWGHDDHFHVRLKCPDGDEGCIPGPAIPAGDGCGAELESWITSGDWNSKPRPSGQPQHVHRPEMPAACRAILSAF
jgi:penicillin-insensitive murein endopeptidase